MPIRVKLEVDATTTQGQMILRSCSDEFGKFEIIDKGTPDFIVTQSTVFAESARSPEAHYPSNSPPVVCFERIDGANLSSHGRLAVRDKRVVALLKVSMFVDKPQYNYSFFGGFSRRHESAIFKTMLSCAARSDNYWRAPTPKLTEDELNKIDVLCGWEIYPQLEPAFDLAKSLLSVPPTPRPIDVFFAGTTDYPLSPIGWHRMKCIEAAMRLKQSSSLRVEVFSGRVMSKTEYLSMMSQSKVVLCPAGWGETTQRDYEAAMLGCLPLLPHFPWVTDNGPIRESLTLPADFRGIEFLSSVLRDWDDFSEKSRIRAKFYMNRRTHLKNKILSELYSRYVMPIEAVN